MKAGALVNDLLKLIHVFLRFKRHTVMPCSCALRCLTLVKLLLRRAGGSGLIKFAQPDCGTDMLKFGAHT